MPVRSRPLPRRRRRSTRRRPHLSALTTILAFALALAATGCSGEEEGPRLELTAAIPDDVPEDTVLRIGDPATQVALELSGLDEKLPFEVEWANISGGPKTLEALRVDPLEHPTYELGVAPGVDVTDLGDLAGKRIAYSPGQAQGALVLKVLQEAGLGKDDVELVEMTSVDDVYVNALGSGQVDVAPLGQTLVPPFLAKYEQDGGTTISSGVRDDAWHLYAPTGVLEDAHKAAALKIYTEVWAESVEWVNEHPDEYAQAYYAEHEGLSEEDAKTITEALGDTEIPLSWDSVIESHQATADLLEEEQGQEHIDVADLYDRRYEPGAEESKAEGSKQ